MDIPAKLLEPDIQTFIRDNENADIPALALAKPPASGWPYPLILGQIAARQKARVKIPSWCGPEGVVFPAAVLLEQASSEATAHYKASLVSGNAFADLTAGAGVDFLALSSRFREGIAIEKDENAASCLQHNLGLMGAGQYTIIHGDAENAVETLPPCDLIYLDPQRRNEGKKGLFRLEECSPDILALLPVLCTKAKTIMIKTSPVLDIDLAVKTLGGVSAVHVVEWRGDCREVLYMIEPGFEGEPSLTAVSINDHGQPLRSVRFTRAGEKATPLPIAVPGKYLFEPSPAFQKAGCFRTLAAHYHLAQLHPHTHLYTGPEPCPGFPGRAFEIQAVYPVSGKTLTLRQANLAIRNFPSSVDSLKKKLKLKDGGEDYLFACTLEDGRKALIHGRRESVKD